MNNTFTVREIDILNSQKNAGIGRFAKFLMERSYNYECEVKS